MKPKFHPTPSSISPTQKCQSVMPAMLIAALAISMTKPAAITRSTPKREISVPVKKLGTNMPSTCHCNPSAASVTLWLHSIMASGAAVITMFIMA